jgi:hypothetical protein
MKCCIITVTTGATGFVTKGLRIYLEETRPEKLPKDFLQETAALGTSHIIRKVLQPEI